MTTETIKLPISFNDIDSYIGNDEDKLLGVLIELMENLLEIKDKDRKKPIFGDNLSNMLSEDLIKEKDISFSFQLI